MPKDKETSNHPCHFLSLPSARRFWCRHCMSVFEDAITRWRHSRTCRYGVVSNFMKRRELEAKALQNTTKPNPIEARLEQSVEAPDVAPTEGSIVDTGEGSSNPNNKKGDKLNAFQCFICHCQFSSMEEMRHHVKFPCNQKKTEIADDDQAAVTIYIDEFTDRSRPWDPAPQPQQEEVYTSEYIPSMGTSQAQTVHTNVELATRQEEPMITEQTPVKKQDNIKPTNIYVNEQGETVIEVENLDLNTEGGELSLAHLLTQLSQQGIVFDKSKTGQMQGRQEMTVSDPASGKIYTTSTLEHSSIAAGIKNEEDEGQPTAEDAANTLAQLAGFRGFRNNQESNDGTQIVQHQSTSQPQVFETSEGYKITTSMPGEPAVAAANQSDAQLGREMVVKYEYQYYDPSTQQMSSTNTDEHVAIQTIVKPGDQGYEEEMLHQLPVHFYEDRSTPQEVTYITTQGDHQPGATSIQALQSGAIGTEGQRVVIDNSTDPVIIQQYGVTNADSTSQQFVNYPVQLPSVTVSETENSAQAIFHNRQSVNIVGNSEDVLCHTEESMRDAQNSIHQSHSIDNNLSQKNENETTHSSGEQIVRIEADYTTSTDNKGTESHSDEFAIQTVSLQEIVEAESSNSSVAFVDKNGIISTSQNSASNPQIIQTVGSNPQFIQTVKNGSQIIQTMDNNPQIIQTVENNQQIIQAVDNNQQMIQQVDNNQEIIQAGENNLQIIQTIDNDKQIIQAVDNNQQIIQTVDNNQQIIQTVDNNQQIIQTVDHDQQIIQTVDNDQQIIQTVDNNQQIIQTVDNNQQIIQGVDNNQQIYQEVENNQQIYQVVESNHLHAEGLGNLPDQHIVHVNDSGNLVEAATQQQSTEIALADRYVINDAVQGSSAENEVASTNSNNEAMPIFVVSSEGLQLVSGPEPRSIVTQAQMGL